MLTSFFKLLNKVFWINTREKVLSEKSLTYIESNHVEEIYKQHTHPSFTVFKSYDDFDCLIFRRQTGKNDQPFFLRVWAQKFSNIQTYATSYGLRRPGVETLVLQSMEADVFLVSKEKRET